MLKFAAVLALCACTTVLYSWIYTSVLGFELPKTAYLKRVNDAWSAKVAIIDRNLDKYDATLTGLQLRDDDIYRSIFGMNPIAVEVRNAGFGGVNRYAYLEGIDNDGRLRNAVMRIDMLTKKSYVQSRSYDEVGVFSKRAGDMASCVPKISPIVPDNSKYRLSSGFGVRTDPVYGGLARHMGLDFAMPIGNPVYSTGDGTVVSVIYGKSGYGNNVMIDHGFGYRTRYAHMSSISVEEGMKLKRGDFIGKSGNSGKSSGPHLHYEVIYMGRPVNPINYLDLEISPEEYSSMLRHVEAESDIALHPSHVKRK
ncbi:MAG: M23 family metallopeptidase [Bacteroidales bacterium]|nr:M23 family metallopeptidase [Bacteroides sp.]MCM1502310.1 M23 family metallopeptidase [Bacteroidales bacterium]